MTILRSGWLAYELGMAPGESQLLWEYNPCLTFLRNFLKQRKQKKLAEERGERSQTGTSVAHEKSGDTRRSEQSNGNLHAVEQDDWRQVCLPPILCMHR
jgi:hypothetical protein